MSRPLRVGIVQQSCSDDREENLQRSEAGIRDAAAQGARLVLLQELHTSLYFCQHESTDLFNLAEPIPGPSTQLLGALAVHQRLALLHLDLGRLRFNSPVFQRYMEVEADEIVDKSPRKGGLIGMEQPADQLGIILRHPVYKALWTRDSVSPKL